MARLIKGDALGVASENLNRNFIGVEKDDKYFEIARNEIERCENDISQ